MALNSAFSLSGLLETGSAVPFPSTGGTSAVLPTRSAPGQSNSLGVAAKILEVLNAQPTRSLKLLDLLKEVCATEDLSLSEFQTLLESLISMGWIVREREELGRDYMVRAVKN